MDAEVGAFLDSLKTGTPPADAVPIIGGCGTGPRAVA